MKADVNHKSCGREDDLIGFIYSDLSDDEAVAFRAHVQDCASCEVQISSFTGIRESIVAWRNESLGSISKAHQDVMATTLDRRRPSALAAMREFFNLSPVWLKGAVALGSVLFCIFTVLAIARFGETPSTIATTGPQQPSQQELNAVVERRVQDELQRIKASNETAATATAANTPADQVPDNRVAQRGNQKTASASLPSARRPLTKVERQELAADLRLLPGRTTGELELLDDRINQ